MASFRVCALLTFIIYSHGQNLEFDNDTTRRVIMMHIDQIGFRILLDTRDQEMSEALNSKLEQNLSCVMDSVLNPLLQENDVGAAVEKKLLRELSYLYDGYNDLEKALNESIKKLDGVEKKNAFLKETVSSLQSDMSYLK